MQVLGKIQRFIRKRLSTHDEEALRKREENLKKWEEALQQKEKELKQKEKALKKTVLKRFHEDVAAAHEAYFHFNGDTPISRKHFHPDLIARAVEFDYLNWPRKIAADVQGKDVLDVGCGTGLHAVGYVVVGCRSYTGMDPKIDMDSDQSKDLRLARWAAFGWTPRQLADLLPNVTLVSGTFEDVAPDATFDIAVLHNVTEHLLDIETVFRGIWERLRPEGVILYNHHNFYCWNGHHRQPKSVDKINPDDPEQAQYLDWAHLSIDPPEGHLFRTKLNRIRMDDLRRLTECYFDIVSWEEKPIDDARGAGRLTPEIRERYKQYSERELTTQNVLCRATKRS